MRRTAHTQNIPLREAILNRLFNEDSVSGFDKRTRESKLRMREESQARLEAEVERVERIEAVAHALYCNLGLTHDSERYPEWRDLEDALSVGLVEREALLDE